MELERSCNDTGCLLDTGEGTAQHRAQAKSSGHREKTRSDIGLGLQGADTVHAARRNRAGKVVDLKQGLGGTAEGYM